MEYIGNITFVIDPARRDEFITWMRGKALLKLFNSESPAREPRLTTVVEAGGEKPGPDHGASIALQAVFASEGDAVKWQNDLLPEVLGDFHKTFGQHSAFFVTLLEVIPL